MGRMVSHCQLEVISLTICGGVQVKLLQDCNYFMATSMIVQGIQLQFVMSNTGIKDIESQDLIPYYLASFCHHFKPLQRDCAMLQSSLQLIYQ